MKKIKNNVLAEGEVTGHAHRAVGKGVIVYQSTHGRDIEAPSGATITHEEHHHITIPAGDYETGIVREQDHFAQDIKQITD